MQIRGLNTYISENSIIKVFAYTFCTKLDINLVNVLYNSKVTLMNWIDFMNNYETLIFSYSPKRNVTVIQLTVITKHLQQTE